MKDIINRLSEFNWKEKLPLLILIAVTAFVLFSPVIRAIRYSEVRGDSALYMSYLLSVFEDGDLELGDDYLELDPLIAVNHQNHLRKTEAGYTVATFPPGPAILWSPFFLVIKGYHAITGETDREAILDDYSRFCQYGTTAYSLAAVFLFFFFLKRFFSPWVASIASLASLFLTPFLGYAYILRLESHGLGFFSVVLLLWYSTRSGRDRNLKQWAILGAILGLVFLIRWMDVVVVIWLLAEQLPVLIEVFKQKKFPLQQLKSYAILGLGFFLAILPQIVVILVVFGFGKGPMSYGANFVEWFRPEVLNILFSSRNGLFSWHPMIFFAFIGLFLLLKKKTSWAIPSLAVLVLVTYLNSVTGDWWAGHAFGMRRYCSFIPFLGIGFAGILSSVKKKWFLAAVTLVFIFFGFWNFFMLQNYMLNNIPHQPTVSELNPVKVKREWVNKFGYPITWPGEIIFRFFLDGVNSKQAEWLVSRQLIFCDDGLKGNVLPEYPSFQDGFSELRKDEKGEYRELESKGKVYIYRLARHAAEYLTIEADITDRIMERRKRSVVGVTLNGKLVGMLIPKKGEHTINSFVHTPPRMWNYGINRLEFELFEGRKSMANFPMITLQKEQRLDMVKPALGRHKLRIRKIEFAKKPFAEGADQELIRKAKPERKQKKSE